MKHIIVLAGWLTVMAGAARAMTQEQIGSWVLSCPGAGPCVLRVGKRFLDTGGITANLEVLAAGQSLVPVVTLRGLPAEMLMAASLAGTTEASMQFGGGSRVALACGASGGAYICAPRDAAARVLSSGLPAARSVTVRVSVVVGGMKPFQIREKTLGLSGTNEALARLRTAGAKPVPGPMTALMSQSPVDFMAMAERVLREAGYPNGVAGLVAKYRGR
jgi:hypothetical protein